MPSVSVIIAAFNPGNLLQRSLASVLNQTHTDFEVLVIDDASTEDITLTPGMEDERVRHVRLPRNRGVGVVLNTGVVEAASPYVAFLAHDDDWMPTKLERQLAALEGNSDAPFCYTDFEWVLPDGTRRSSDSGQITYSGLLSSQTVSFCSVVMARDAYLTVGGMSSLLTWAQDFDFLLRCLDGAPEPLYVPELLTRYYIHGQNHSRNYRGSVGYREHLLRLHQAKAERQGLDDVVQACNEGLRRARELRGAQAFDQARLAYRAHDYGGTARELLETARSQPGILAAAVARRFARA